MNIFLWVYIENIVKNYRDIFLVFWMKALSEGELSRYLEAEKQRICEKYGEFTDRTIREFIEEGCAERFHDKYFREHCLDR